MERFNMTPRRILQLLHDYESRNVTFIEPDGSWPIVWDQAQGVQVTDAAGRIYLDLTAAFGVAAAGHANARVVRAGRRQMGRLLHAMGDVHPHAQKAKLARELSRVSFERWASEAGGWRAEGGRRKTEVARGKLGAKTIFCNSGFEAVEAALKTAKLATGRRGVIAFIGGYHGLGYGALNATHRGFFRDPFRSQLGRFGMFAPFPTATSAPRDSGFGHSGRSRKSLSTTITLEMTAERIEILFRRHAVGAVLVEPIQVRGGVNIPPPGFLPLLRRLCDTHGALLVLDEIYTGFGRTGKWFACEHSGIVPDLICLGKALTGGFPLSACVGRAEVMDAAWPPSGGEAIHTSTFLGHPVGCAMALAQIAEIRRLRLVERSRHLGDFLLGLLKVQSSKFKVQGSVRGCGLLAGIELRRADGAPAATETLQVLKGMLRRGFILLPEGEYGNVISFTPPLIISERQLRRTVGALTEELRRLP